ncbi:MAG TPA: type II toxin-antitoxin system death-on-curing family toxin [Abditibacteriaceae bacterium]
MKYLSVAQVMRLHEIIVEASGGSAGLRDRNILESAVAQPRMGFGGSDLYPTPAQKAAVLGFALVSNHAFVDGNKRIGYEAMVVFLEVNGYTFNVDTDTAELAVLGLAARKVDRQDWTQWVSEHLEPLHDTNNS